jgi:cell division protein FtsL
VSASVPYVWEKRIDNSRLIRQRDPGYAREGAALLGGALFCLVVVLLCAWQHFEYLQAGYQLEEMRSRHAQVQEWNRTLRLEQAALLDPMRIDMLARSRLGLGAPAADRVVPMGSGEEVNPAPLLAREIPSGSVQPPEALPLAD